MLLTGKKKALQAFEGYFFFSLFKVLVSCLNFRWNPEPIATRKIRQIGRGLPYRCSFLCDVKFLLGQPSIHKSQVSIFEWWDKSCPQITSCGEIKGKYFGFLSPKACLTILERFPQPFCEFRLELNWILNLFHWTEPLPCMSNFTNVFSKGPDSRCFCTVGHLVSVTNSQLRSCHTKAAEDKAQMNGCDRVPKSITQPHWWWAGFGLLPIVCWPLSYTICEFYFFFFYSDPDPGGLPSAEKQLSLCATTMLCSSAQEPQPLELVCPRG